MVGRRRICRQASLETGRISCVFGPFPSSLPSFPYPFAVVISPFSFARLDLQAGNLGNGFRCPGDGKRRRKEAECIMRFLGSFPILWPAVGLLRSLFETLSPSVMSLFQFGNGLVLPFLRSSDLTGSLWLIVCWSISLLLSPYIPFCAGDKAGIAPIHLLVVTSVRTHNLSYFLTFNLLFSSSFLFLAYAPERRKK